MAHNRRSEALSPLARVFEPISASGSRKPGVALRTLTRSTDGCSIERPPQGFEQLVEAFGRLWAAALEAVAAAVRWLGEALAPYLPGPRADLGDPCGDGIRARLATDAPPVPGPDHRANVGRSWWIGTVDTTGQATAGGAS